MTTATHFVPHPFFIAAELASKRWWKNHATLGSVLLHGSALLAVWAFAAGTSTVLPKPPVIELIRVKLDTPPLVPPKPEPVKDKPVALAPPKPVAQALPTPKTVQAAAAQAETFTPPATPAQVAPIGPVTPVAPTAPVPVAATPAPAPAPAKASDNEGIPTDYVNQVYARINRNTDYPREARQRRQQGRVGYRLKLSAQGALLGVEIQSSGIDSLDEAARDAIQRAAPFGKLPELGGSSYLLSGAIVFKIN